MIKLNKSTSFNTSDFPLSNFNFLLNLVHFCLDTIPNRRENQKSQVCLNLKLKKLHPRSYIKRTRPDPSGLKQLFMLNASCGAFFGLI